MEQHYKLKAKQLLGKERNLAHAWRPREFQAEVYVLCAKSEIESQASAFENVRKRTMFTLGIKERKPEDSE